MKLRISAIFLLLLAVGFFNGCDHKGIISPPEDNLPPSDYTNPSWSPDGRRIAYYHENYNHDSSYPSGLYLIDTSGANRVLLIEGFAGLPHWSPDGKWIVFSYDGLVCLIKPNGDSLLGVVGGDFPRWSPDGNKIVYTRSGTPDTVGIWIFDLKGGTRHRLGYGGYPDWSPDGTKFIYMGGPSTIKTEGQIWMMDTSGNNRKQLTMNSFSFNRHPFWSHDNNMIAWTILSYRTREIWLMQTDGSNQHILTEGSDGSFSPDSRQVVFSRINAANSNYNLWIININGTNLRQLTH
ncbi:MAG: hypothetical protein ACHQQQ_13055 [Bacteroidota bacterium]